jgi:signal transduction histidine kinase
LPHCSIAPLFFLSAGNGLKFTERGGLTIRLGCDGEFVRIDVADTGVGMDESFIPKLFDDFTQESEGISRNYEGVGLGLSITRRLVDLMDGTIDVASEPGAGSTFTVRLPRGGQNET